MRRLHSKNKYWDIHDILAGNEILTCEVEKDLYNINELDKTINFNNSEENVIKQETKLELPLWMALDFQDNELVKIHNPKFFNKKLLNHLQVDPVIANLKTKSNYFYEVAMKLIPYLDENKQWEKCLAKTFSKRYLFLLQNSVNVKFENYGILKNLSYKEKIFYEKMISIHRAFKFFTENYSNNNKTLEDGVNYHSLKKKKLK
jgi:GINS complex protein